MMKITLKYLSFLCLFFLTLLFNSCGEKGIEAPYSLTVSEGFENPMGFYNAEPTFSWKLPVNEKLKAQSAYRIVAASKPKLLPNNADLWNSEKVESNQSIFVNYEGERLDSRKQVYWQIRYWDQDNKPSEWSEITHFELGLLHNSDWNAKWISLPQEQDIHIDRIDRNIHSPQYFRNDFQIGSTIKKARLYITSKGVFQAEINGEKVGEDAMTPGWTPYKKRIETLTYDVTDLLTKGENTLGVILAEGWHSGQIYFKNKPRFTPEVMAQLEITNVQGEIFILSSDESWKATRKGPIVYSSIYDGELYDANKVMPDWSSPDFNATQWQNVIEEDISTKVKLRPKTHNTVKTKVELPTLGISKLDNGMVIFDMGQNMVGVPRLNIPVKKGDTITVNFAEMLQQDGSLYTENYRSAISTDYYVPCKNGTIEWQPTFTFHGYRYVGLSGFDTTAIPDKSWLTGIVQHSDFKMNGSFSSSHEKLNQLQSNITWGLRGNFLDIPTDCPQRNERLGWTGDAQVFTPTSYYIANVHSFWASWLESVREEQFENGGIPWMVPNMHGQRYSAGWGDACVIIPWESYWRTGDTKILADNYAMMKKWLSVYTTQAKDNLVEFNIFGDWLQPYSSHNKRGDTPTGLICTAYYGYSALLIMRTAEVLGNKEESAAFKALFEDVRTAFQQEYFNDDGEIKDGQGTQTGYLLAIGFDLLTPEMQQKAIPHLLSQIKNADNHLRTGFLGTPLLAPVLDKIGAIDLMYEILFMETYPSWFYSINQGATTMWERWNSYSNKDGFGDASMNSFNHYAYGAIGEWMYERIAGISAIEAGYKKIRIAPQPGGPLTSAKGAYNSYYGEITSEWKLEHGVFTLNVVIPPNTTAEVSLPTSYGDNILVNDILMDTHPLVKIVDKDGKFIILEVNAGSYSFKMGH